MKRKGLSIFNRLMLLLNSAAIAGLLISYIASYVSPSELWITGIFGLSYPVLLFVNVLFIFYWLFQWKWYFALSSLSVLVGYNYLMNTFQLKMRTTNYVYLPGSRPVKVLSYNVRLFDLYNWTGDRNTKKRIFELIDRISPDLACIQEFYSSGKILNNRDSLMSLLNTRYVHIEFTGRMREGNWGIATFSRFPIVGKGKIDFKTKSNNLCIYTDIKAGKDTIRIYNVHFQSIRFANEDYQFMKNISDNKPQQELQGGSRKILRRLKVAFIKRGKQVSLVTESIRNSPYPVIVCGDFNDPPSSYTYHSIRSTLKDAFVESGNGLGNTYNGIFPSFRIDYILHDPRYRSFAFRTIKRDLSDHFPITCTIDLKP
jgi:endonuclease/exonuclease/phosphatase family metal-dependent hydrolase